MILQLRVLFCNNTGMNRNVVRLQLEGLFSNPGIDMDLIMVCNYLLSSERNRKIAKQIFNSSIFVIFTPTQCNAISF